MIRRLFRAVVRTAVLAGAVAAGVAVVRARTRREDPLPRPAAEPAGGPWPPLRNESPAPDEVDAVVAPEPAGVPVADAPSGPERPTGAWAEPDADGSCPDGFPIKAKMSSKIFHAPGQLNYDRTTPDRCYATTTAAEADGLRAAKR